MLALSALGVAGAMALTACSSSGSSKSSSAGGVTTINLLAADYGTAGTANSSQTYWQGIADAFHAANPSIVVHVQTIPWTDYQTKTTAMFQAKQYPDILEGDAPQEFAADNLLYPLTDVMSASTISNLIPVFVKQEDTNNIAYGAPFTTSSRVLFYNKKLFTQAKIASPPTTWAQLESDAAAIKALPGGNIGYDMPLGTEEAQGESLMWMLGNDGNYTDGTGKYAINSANNIETFQFMANLVKAGDTEAGPATQDRKTAWADFASGDVGMVGGSGALVPIINTAGKLQSADWGDVAMPGKNGPLTTPLAVHDDITAFNLGGHAAQIKAFLDFAYQDKYQEQFDNEYDLLPATSSASAALSASNPVDAPFLAALPNGSQYPTNSNWTPVTKKIQNTIGAAVASPGAASTVLGELQAFASSSNN
ncbi:extracellular solute-binding protein [Streptacidiphilus sp. P02-A3a]|uniref:extracellular solute-binding protein n=1 Tax=Streptacidiphilus sp. P02-A3a TaxID=2704468 RepID=UPI0015F8AAA5|nr:extracellular solute-binding protein [Streptacidiphilus sp. P02-A3a]QMU67465.1 extracellular solute-binding protein [Streptacidiphilus sp. P02-A3a]